jgi:hypothetical protein
MKGRSQPHLMRCDDDQYYVVKFTNNPLHKRILANEMLATRLAGRLGLCVPQVDIVEVHPELIAYTSELAVQSGTRREPCSSGKQFGSLFPGNPARVTVHDVLPGALINKVGNVSDFLGVFVFDKWTCNTDFRQAIFFREAVEPKCESSNTLNQDRYIAMMIDQGACFNGGEWNFPDAPIHGICQYEGIYESVTGMDAFDPWIERLEELITESVLHEEASRIPQDWIGEDQSKLNGLLHRLYERRMKVRELIEIARRSDQNPFPNWNPKATLPSPLPPNIASSVAVHE